MLVLFETPAGYAIFKVLDEKKIEKVDNLFLEFQTPEAASKILKLKHFEKFTDMTVGLAAATATVEGKVSKPLKKLLKKLIVKDAQDQLMVADAKLGVSIKEKMQISCINNNSVMELMRCIRSQADGLIGSLPKKEMDTMALGLAHSLSRYKLKFSPDKVDTMIVQAVSLLDDLDKELNNYIMRCKEWYGWHFPELSKIVTDNIPFVKTVRLLGFRTNASSTDFSAFLPEDREALVKEAAEISMGSEISDEDMENINFLADQIIEMSDYRTQLYEYMKARMMAIAPNLTVLVGELVGARLIAHAGTLLNLAKHPASTIQILGAEKALFRALKTKKDTPKYGLIYHAQLVGAASTKTKGKVSRMLAAKAALATRVDALGEDVSISLGTEHKAYLEHRLKHLEDGALKRISGGKKGFAPVKYNNKSEIRSYPTSADSTMGGKRKYDEGSNGLSAFKKEEEPEEQVVEESEPKKKKKKKAKIEPVEEQVPEPEPIVEEGKKKKKKRKLSEVDAEVKEEEEAMDNQEIEGSEIKKKKKKKKEKVVTP